MVTLCVDLSDQPFVFFTNNADFLKQRKMLRSSGLFLIAGSSGESVKKIEFLTIAQVLSARIAQGVEL